MDDIITFLRCNIGNIIALCGVFGIGLEIAPVNIRPISWILKKAGNVINEDLIKKVNILDTEFKEFKDDEYMERINSIRKEIVDFSLSCQRKERHTRDEFDRIFKRMDTYHNLLDKYGMENGKIDIEVGYINNTYRKCLEENKFFEG